MINLNLIQKFDKIKADLFQGDLFHTGDLQLDEPVDGNL